MYILTERPEGATISSLNFLSAAPSKDCQIVLPQGKGMIIVGIRETETPNDVAKRVSDTGLSWLAITRVTQLTKDGKSVDKNRDINSTKKIKDYVDKLRSDVNKDFGIWIYGGHPNPSRKEEFISALVDAAVDVGAQGVIANPEAPWLTEKGRREGKNFIDSLLKQARENCLSVGITSYRSVARKVPWEEFSRVDFGLPQIYTATLEEGIKAVDDWKDKGFKVVIPLLGTAPKYKLSASAKAMQETYDNIPKPDCAVAWWSWANTKLEARWNVIQKAKMPTSCTSRLPADYSCVMPRLGGLGLQAETKFCARVPLSDTPKPCRFYTIKKGIDSKGLIDLAGRAYGEPSAAKKVTLAQWINNHSYNRRFWKADLATSSFPQGRISFSPGFFSDILKQAQATGSAPKGNAFATIFIPPPPPWVAQTFPSCSNAFAR